MAKKDWYYVPIQYDQAHALDEIIKKEGRKYGIKDRNNLARIILGRFIYQFEMMDQTNILKAMDDICSMIDSNKSHQQQQQEEEDQEGDDDNIQQKKNHLKQFLSY